MSQAVLDHYYGFPQRVMLGIPPEETLLALSHSARLNTALNYITLDMAGVFSAVAVTQDGKPSLAVGTGGIQARVYRPTTEEQATRNLNFAIANLTAYIDWDQHGRAEQARIEKEREENLRKAEAEAKRKAEAEAAERRLRETRLKNGLNLFNKVQGTAYSNWAFTYVSPLKQEAWAKQAEQIASLQRITNPYSSSIFNAMLRADSLYPTSIRL